MVKFSFFESNRAIDLLELAMPTRFSTYNRRWIVTLQQQGKTTSQIVARLREEGVTTTAKTVKKWLHRWNSNLGLEDNFQTGRNSKITMEITSFIEEQLVRDDEISSRELTHVIITSLYVHTRSYVQTYRLYYRWYYYAIYRACVRTFFPNFLFVAFGFHPNRFVTFPLYSYLPCFIATIAPTVMSFGSFTRRCLTFILLESASPFFLSIHSIKTSFLPILQLEYSRSIANTLEIDVRNNSNWRIITREVIIPREASRGPLKGQARARRPHARFGVITFSQYSSCQVWKVWY